MLVHPRAVLALLAALFILGLPAAASAAVIEVTSVGDEADKTPGAPCETNAGAGVCSLRAAIEVSNSTAAVRDTILFKATVFEGQLADTIEPATVLPIVTSPVEINAGTCMTAALVNGPCAGVKGPSGETVLTVEADETEIFDLAVTGGSFGIVVGGASTDFTAEGNWIGVKLDGNPGGNTSTGIFLDPNSNSAQIGGTEAVQRNVISNNGTGLDIEGADDAVIEGNYFGVTPKGDAAAANSEDIEITDRVGLPGAAAEGNEIGTNVAAGPSETAACDGGCNVISGAAGNGIDLNGETIQAEAPATGPTFVRGNYVGLNAAGTGTLGNGTFAILAGGADDVTVGGAESSGDRNLIAGSSFGVYAENGDNLEVRNNSIGFGSTGGTVTSPGEVGIFAFALTLGGPGAGASIISNTVRMEGGVGIEHRFTGASIAGNTLEGGVHGILTRGDADGSLIAGNMIEGTGEAAIQLQNSDNEVRGNKITETGAAGIQIYPGAAIDVSGNVIGGNEAARENVIDDALGSAIEIVGIEESRNEVRRNRGSGNGAAFIGLVPFSIIEADPNGVLPPAIATAKTTQASGTAEPEAVVRVFRKASSEAGELAGFLGEAVADGSGNWKAPYEAAVPAGTLVVATQTLEGGTSELSATATTVADPPPSGGGGNPPPPPIDTTAPRAKITKGPKAKSKSSTAKFTFSSNEKDSTFQCKLDKGKFKKCRSPKTYKKLKPGKHAFQVRATDVTGNVGRPAKRKFTVLG